IGVRHVASPVETVVTPDHNFFVGDLSTISPSRLPSRGYAKVLEQPTKFRTSKLTWKEVGNAESDTFLLPRRIAFELPDHFDLDLGEFARRDSSLDRYRRTIDDSYVLGYVF